MFSLFYFSSIFSGGQLTPFAPMCGRPCVVDSPILSCTNFISLHFIHPEVQLKRRIHAYNATYNSLGRCSKALSTLTTAPCKEKRKKQVRIKKYKQSDNIDECILKKNLHVVLKKKSSFYTMLVQKHNIIRTFNSKTCVYRNCNVFQTVASDLKLSLQ